MAAGKIKVVNLVVPADSLTPGGSYSFVLTASYDDDADGDGDGAAAEGAASLSLLVNRAPTPGSARA